MNDNEAKKLAIEVGKRHLNKKRNGVTIDEITGLEVINGLEAVKIGENFYSMRNGQLLEWCNDYLREIRKEVGHRPLYLPGTGIVIFRYDEKGDLWFYLQLRADLNQIGLFGGGNNPCENSKRCARRELREEISSVVKEEDLILLDVYSGYKHITRHNNGDIVLHMVVVFAVDFKKCIFMNDKAEGDGETKKAIWINKEQLRWKLENTPDEFFPNNIPILWDMVTRFSF